MAVTLPSDLIADVMRAADPSRQRMAVAKLGSSEPSRIAFSGVIDGLLGSPRVRDRSDDLIADVVAAADSTNAVAAETRLAELAPLVGVRTADANEPYKAFEQMVLRNMFESMMPSADSGIYGGESSAGIWRSLANDQLASVYSDWGGLGIARALGDSKEMTHSMEPKQWPYFETAAIRSFVG